MRVTNAAASRKRRKKMLTLAKGFRMRRSKLYRYAKDAIYHGLQYSYRDRKAKKRDYRALWQVRINAAARAAGTTYSRFMEGLKAAGCALDIAQQSSQPLLPLDIGQVRKRSNCAPRPTSLHV
ncbi:MAG: 50S ribosomal protein L20 [Verrucomicrobiota bacterium]